MHWSSACLVHIQYRACAFFCRYTCISGLSMPVLVTHKIHGPTSPTACVIGSRYFVYLPQNTNLFSATIVHREGLPACLSVATACLCNVSSFCCGFTVLVQSYFNFISCCRVGTTRTGSTSSLYLCMPHPPVRAPALVCRFGRGGDALDGSAGGKRGGGGIFFFDAWRCRDARGLFGAAEAHVGGGGGMH